MRIAITKPSVRSQQTGSKAQMPDLLCEHSTDEILAMPLSRKWHQVFRDNREQAIEVLLDCSHLEDNVIISEFRGVQVPPVSRFILYTLKELAAGNISVQISDGELGVWNEIAVGHSIFNRSSMVDVGDLCAWYGGGGHRTVGVCRPSEEDTEQVLREIIQTCKEQPTS